MGVFLTLNDQEVSKDIIFHLCHGRKEPKEGKLFESLYLENL